MKEYMATPRDSPERDRVLEAFDLADNRQKAALQKVWDEAAPTVQALVKSLMNRGPSTAEFEAWAKNLGGDRIYDNLLGQGYSGEDPMLKIRSAFKILGGAPARAQAGSGNYPLREFVSEDPRAWASRTTGKLNMTSDISYRVLMHEMGHFAEFSDSRYGIAAEQWVLSRATSQETMPLNKLVPGGRYSDNEIAYPDKFISPYVGKKYEGAYTEVFSMGVEKFSNADMLTDFFLADRDHFMFVLGILEDL